MTARNDETGTQERATSPMTTSVPQDPDATRAANPVLSPSSAMTTTAEIPITNARTAAPRTVSAGYRDDAWYHEHDHNRKAPAPVGLRIAVWLLFAVFVIFLIGLAIEHSHPTWVSFLRQTGTITGAHFVHFP